MRKRLAPDGFALTERLCVYPRYIDPEWIAQGVLDVDQGALLELHPAPRLRPARRRPKGALRPDTIARAPRRRARSAADELTALFAETRPEVIEDMRQAADELRAELAGDTVTFVVNRNINVSNVCIVGCAFCGFGQGRRSPDAYTHERGEFAARIARGGRVRRDRALHPVGHPSRLGRSRTTRAGCGSPGTRRRELHLHAYSPMEVAHMCDRSRPAAARGLRAAARRRARLGAGHRRGGARRRRARADQPEQAAGRALGRDRRGRARAPGCARP